MMQIGLDDLCEEDLKKLLGTAENFRIEFKSELNLASKEQRTEAAKDLSALANSAGGRIFYGINEIKRPDGSMAADRITPLTDFDLKARLEDIIADTVHPQPHWRVVPVEVEGGFVLVAEVYPSLGRDLHMVSGDRFYRRGEARTIKMTEPEIREAYNRISLSSLALEQALATTIKDEEELVADYCQSVIVVPWYPRRGLVDPRVHRDIGRDLVEGPFKRYRTFDTSYWDSLRNIRAYANGLRAHVERPAPFDLFITRDGLVHVADKRILEMPDPAGNVYLDTVGMLQNILAALGAAHLILDRCHYWGPVHVIQVLRVPKDNARVQLAYNNLHSNCLSRGRYEQVMPEVNLAEQGKNMEAIARDLCDQFFQALGTISCPLFSEDGHIREEVRKWGSL